MIHVVGAAISRPLPGRRGHWSLQMVFAKALAVAGAFSVVEKRFIIRYNKRKRREKNALSEGLCGDLQFM
ncbi:MAG: hypothetical protein E7453_08015 [Ruminococcaceae bacterium]|nr:hypothetical protein [Oscillospiraceae bacterium]